MLVTRDDHVRVVDLDSGKSMKAEFGPALLHAARTLPWARSRALAILRTKPLVKGVKSLQPLLEAERVSAMDRLRTAIVLHERKLRPIEAADFEPALKLEKTTRMDAGWWAVEAKRALTPAAAHALFERAALKARAPLLAATAVYGLQLLDTAEAGATVVRLISHADAPPPVRAAAAKSAGQMKAAHVLPRLLRDVKGMEHDPATAGLLLDAAFALDPNGLTARLGKEQAVALAVLKRGNGPQEFLTAYFAQHPTTEAIDPLLNRLRRVRDDARKRQITIIALRECSGQDFGDDVDAWLTKTVR